MKGKMKRDPVDPWTSPPLAHSKQWLQNKGTLILSRCCASLVGTCRHACTHGTAQRQVFVRQWERGNAGGSWDARQQSRHRHTHTPQCCNPKILMLCAMAHCRAPWQFTSSLRHTDQRHRIHVYWVSLCYSYYVCTSLMPDQSLWSKRRCQPIMMYFDAPWPSIQPPSFVMRYI